MDIHTRIRQRRIDLGLTPAAFAKEVGVTRSAIMLWELPTSEGGTVPTHARQKKVADVLKISVFWLLTGRADSLKASGRYVFLPSYVSDSEGGQQVTHPIEVEYLMDQPDTYAYRVDFLQQKGISPENARVWITQDDSMEVGTQLLFDLSKIAVEAGKVYLIETKMGARVRRLATRHDGTISMKADNPNYPEEIVLPDAIRVVGQLKAFAG